MASTAEGGVGLPSAPVPVTVTEYDVPEARPVRVQSVVLQTTLMGGPPPTGRAVNVNGAPVPGVGAIATSTLVGLLACTSAAGEPAAGVVTVPAGDAGVGAPVDGLVPVAVTS